MAKTKISEFSSTPANNTDIDSINIAEGCAPSGINDAIRELMAQLKDFQTGAVGDSFNGPIGSSTASTGAFTTLSATGAITSTLATGTAPLVIASTTKVANLNVDLLDGADWASPAALGSTTPAAVSATTLAASSTVTLSGGTANGVAYLNGSKGVTSGSALWFDGTNFGVGTGGNTLNHQSVVYKGGANAVYQQIANGSTGLASTNGIRVGLSSAGVGEWYSPTAAIYYINNSEVGRFTSTGLGIGTSSPISKLANTSTNTADAAGLTAGTPAIQWATGVQGYVAAFSNTGAGSQFANGLLVKTTGTSNDADAIVNFESGGVNRLKLTGAGNLGLGVAPAAYSESSKFTINATGKTNGIYINFNGTGADKQILLTNGGSANCFIGTDNTAMTLGTGNTERMRIDSAGNLGLGVTPSAWSGIGKTLQINTGGAISADTANTYLSSNSYYNGTNWIYQTTNNATRYTMATNSHLWYVAPSGTAGAAITFTQAMTLDASGRLGIKQTSPTVDLDVGANDSTVAVLSVRYSTVPAYLSNSYDGTSGLTTLSTNSYNTSNGSASWSAFQNSNYSNAAIQLVSQVTSNGSQIRFLTANAANTNPSEVARIDSSGNLLVGTTATYGGPGRINVGFNQSTNFGITLRNTSATATGIFVSFENSGGTGNGSISQTNSTTVAYNTSSDRRLKTNISPALSASSDIDAIQVVSHGWVSNNDIVKYGVIAQDLELVAPQAVTKGDDGEEIEKVWGVDYSKLVPMLIKEVQSLRKRLADAGL